MTYKNCKTAAELNAYTSKERITRCGYTGFHWSQSGGYASTQHGWRGNFVHTKQNTCRDKQELKEVLSSAQVDALKVGYVPELQMSDYLSGMEVSDV